MRDRAGVLDPGEGCGEWGAPWKPLVTSPGICPRYCLGSILTRRENLVPAQYNGNLIQFYILDVNVGDVYIFERIDDCKLGHLIPMINMMMARTCGECDSNYTDGHNMDEVCPIGRYLPLH